MTAIAPVPAIVAAMLARPMTHEVVTIFADGNTRSFPVRSLGQAENYAISERRKVGRDLINRDTGATVRVTAVEIRVL